MSINIEPYIHKLEILKKYLHLRISGGGYWVNVSAIGGSDLSPKELIQIFFDTGVIVCLNVERMPEIKPLTFDEYYQEMTDL